MKKVSGIVTEFNPFHNGHRYLLQSAKEKSDAVICVMSGSFVQRGEPALLSKSIRAKAALLNGADMVIELPSPYSVATAQNFALAGVSLLKSTTLVNALVFGSESANTDLLQKAADWEQMPDIKSKLDKHLSKGNTFAKSRELAVREISDDVADVFTNPNDILATEYISAANKLQLETDFIPILRVGASHDSDAASDIYSSASKIRQIFDSANFENFVPQNCLEIYNGALLKGNYTSYERFDISAGAVLRNLNREVFTALPDLSEGLDNALYKASCTASSFTDAAEKAKSKRYTLARIRRLLCLALLQIDKKTATALPPYVRVLGISGNGEELLREMVKNCALPVITKPSDFDSLNQQVQNVRLAEARAADFAAYCRKTPTETSGDYTDKFIRI